MNITLTLCALLIGVLYARRELFPGSGPTVAASNRRAPEYVADWNEQSEVGVRMGPASAPVNLVVLSDFECPACRGFFYTVQEARRAHPDDIQVTYVHYPLSYHRFAEPAARAAECADAQGRFEPFHNALFERQDSLGLKPWHGYAVDAGVGDLDEFDSCVNKRGTVPRVVAGRKLGERLSITGTPTVLVNGWRLSSAPTPELLEEHIKSIRSGRLPIGAKPIVAGK